MGRFVLMSDQAEKSTQGRWEKGICVEIEPVRYGANAICTVISDDGILETAEELYRIALKYQMKFTVAQVIKNIVDLDELQNMEKMGHIEFISHSYSHLNMGVAGIPDQVLYHEIVESKEYLEQHFTTPQIAFVPPNNQFSEDAYSIGIDYFYAIRRWKRKFNPLSPKWGMEPLDWLNLGCKGICDVNTTQERNEWVNQCIKQRKWLIEMWHNIDHDISIGYQSIRPIEAEEHIDYICPKRDEGKLWTASFTDAVKYILERQTAHISVNECDWNLWKVCLNSGISEMDSRFRMPLSIKVKLPQGFSDIVIKRKTGTVRESLKKENDVCIAVIEMYPGECVTILGKQSNH